MKKIYYLVGDQASGKTLLRASVRNSLELNSSLHSNLPESVVIALTTHENIFVTSQWLSRVVENTLRTLAKDNDCLFNVITLEK
ncbi:hypothetical protein Phi47:1_gp66 [Cellulophaga phage phi47:1]|nr:hypothetical protein Phi3ST:2_gp66 [Cellulophaga phage phi3ST:2]AGO48261.1 hypothetical protein PhiSM_gp66 [Cellulophaga phage phiSM]AGO49305.1 hypothetical protein Phi38:2_gp66 [Cellulophaga phage phi38:2]AGO49385.1 hypothetical protein Phi3:1_gp66 [Cellulophaga phage phi3:1]AGO49803.1 hypothetical protein Phi47:1_gp66 [Cellulophaga phage phi47:1]